MMARHGEPTTLSGNPTMADAPTLSDEQIVRLGFQMGVGGNVGIEASYTDEQKENRAKLIAFARAILAASPSEPNGRPNAEPGAIPLQAMLDAIDDAPYLSLEQDRWLTKRARALAAERAAFASGRATYLPAEMMRALPSSPPPMGVRERTTS